MVELFAYFFLVILWGAHQLKRSFLIRWRFLIFTLVILVFIFLEYYLTYSQYLLWSANSLGKFLLPPYQSLNYLIFYSYSHFFGPYLISLAVALLVWFFIWLLNYQSDSRFFYIEEGFLASVSIFLVGHPGWLIYLLLIFVFQFLRTLFTSRASRVSLRPLWVPTAIFVILISEILSSFSWWQFLKI
jgi:hypothetical protein